MTVHTPIESRGSGVPIWAIVLTLLVLSVGGVFLVTNLSGENPGFAIPGASQPPPGGSAEPDPAVGQALTESAVPTCSTCHGPDLGGSAAFPSLHGVAGGPVSDNLQDLAAEYPDTWAQLWIAGTPETDGIDRMGMPEFGDQFSLEQIASIVAYLQTLP